MTARGSQIRARPHLCAADQLAARLGPRRAMLRHMPRTLLSGGAVLDARTGGTSVADVVIEGDRIVDVGAGLDGDDCVD